jgi:hypothetical protein
MISFALILMTLPSRVAEVRAGRAIRGGLPDSSLHERSSGVCVKRQSSKTRRLAQTPLQPETDSGDNQGPLNLWQR